MVKRGVVALFALLALLGIVSAEIQCNIMSQTDCSTFGTDVLHISNPTDAHAEFFDQTIYANVICCREVVANLPLSVSKVSGNTAVIGLSTATTNAHVESPGFSDYSRIYLSGSASTVSCAVVAGTSGANGFTECSAAGYDACLATMSSEFRPSLTNMHAADCNTGTAYASKICCDIAYDCMTCNDCQTVFSGLGGCNSNTCSVCGGASGCYYAQTGSSCNDCSGLTSCSAYDNSVSCGSDRCNAGNCAWTGTSCTDLNTDTNNCGSFGNVCTNQNNGIGGCISGQCGTVACQQGYGDCNQDVFDGCEAAVGIDCCGDNADNNCNAFLLQRNARDDDNDGVIDDDGVTIIMGKPEGVDDSCDLDNDGFIDCSTSSNMLCSNIATLPTCVTYTREVAEFRDLYNNVIAYINSLP